MLLTCTFQTANLIYFKISNSYIMVGDYIVKFRQSVLFFFMVTWQKISLSLVTKKSQNTKTTLQTLLKSKIQSANSTIHSKEPHSIFYMFAPFKSVTENLVQIQKLKNMYLTTKYSYPCLFCHAPPSLTESQKWRFHWRTSIFPGIITQLSLPKHKKETMNFWNLPVTCQLFPPY